MRIKLVTLSAVCVISAATGWGADDPLMISLWSDKIPGPSSQMQESIRDLPITDGSQAVRDRHILGVTVPSMSVYLPESPAANRPAVVILPGGGFNILAIDKEGHDVARWLNKYGVAGIVVKYRLPDPKSKAYVPNVTLPDVRRSLRLTRARAEQWRIDPKRIGVTGFSAGGYLTAAIGTMFDLGDADADDPVERESCRPDFIAPIYPLVSLGPLADSRSELLDRMLGPDPSVELRMQFSPEQQVTKETPPAFLVHATDDRLSAEHSIALYLALKRANVPVEMHVYSAGGHGYGIRRRGLPVSSWADRWLEWMRAMEFIAEE